MMYNPYNIVPDLSGKKLEPQLADLEIVVKFGLWDNYTTWLDPALQKDFWYDSHSLSTSSLNISVAADSQIIYFHQFEKFETITINHQFNDRDFAEFDLSIRINDFSTVPVRDNTGRFVCGMIEIQSVKLQNIDITKMLDDTLYGVDADLVIAMTTPTYHWMIKNWPTILPGKFSHVVDIDAIKKYNSNNLNLG